MLAASLQVMAIIPAHLMRSSAGEYDNEAVAATNLEYFDEARSMRV